ncbi:MAG: ABC transporter permease [Gammaproteobacteria bacterium]
MGRFIAKRLLSAIVVLLIVSLLAFLIIGLVPGDAASEMAGPAASAEEIARIRTQLGLDRPFHEQIVRWYANLARGDLGQSLLLHRSVASAIIERAPVTLSLTLLALAILLPLGVACGVLAALRPNTWIDQSLMSLALLGLSLPDFWLGLVLIYVFAVVLGWLPTGGYVAFMVDPAGWLRTMALPALALALTQMGLLARLTRSSMLEVLRQDYVRTARAKGLPEWRVIGKHALANVLVPVVTVIGLSVGLLLVGGGGGVGVFAARCQAAHHRRDPAPRHAGDPGRAALTASAFVFVNIVVDVLYAYLDPRVRYEHG